MNEKYAPRLFEENEGEYLGDGVRKVFIATDDPRFPKVGELRRKIEAQKKDDWLFFGWDLTRKYSPEEIADARCFHLKLVPAFEPVGEECGTTYDESTLCPHCGAGRRQLSDLTLDMRKIPKTRDITSTLAAEWIISQRLAELVIDRKFTGFELRPVRHKARYIDDPVHYDRLPTGRKLLELASAQGLKQNTWEFCVWINRPEQRELLDQIDRENAAVRERRDRMRPKALPIWHQLVVTENAGRTVAPTRFGINPFDEDREGQYRCPLGHTSGFTLLSEIHLSREGYSGADFAVADDLVGSKQGVYVPEPMLIVSPRCFALLREHKMKAFQWDVAHLV